MRMGMPQTEMARPRTGRRWRCHPVARRHERRVQDPGGRTELRGLRLDHGPQRQLLQVPQLRLNERLQLNGTPFVKKSEIER